MKVKELTERLNQIDPHREVTVRKDAKGNCFSPLSDLWEGTYWLSTQWNGDASHKDPIDEDLIAGGTKAVFSRPAH